MKIIEPATVVFAVSQTISNLVKDRKLLPVPSIINWAKIRKRSNLSSVINHPEKMWDLRKLK